MQKKQPLILTLQMDPGSQAFFNAERRLYFPVERNLLDAHLTLFHQLPDEPATHDYLADFQYARFEFQVTGLLNLGAGVAYKIESDDLQSLHKLLYTHFIETLITQDKQSFRPHITVMNKMTPMLAKRLLTNLSSTFKAFPASATGLELWVYNNGPWQHCTTIKFH